MSEPPFHATYAGRQFLKSTLPDLCERIGALAQAVERLVFLQESRSEPPAVLPVGGPIEVGSLVQIAFNPHRATGPGAIGRVVAHRVGAGAGGIDLFDVRYTDAETGDVETLPFGRVNLRRVREPDLAGLAAYHEAAAIRLRLLLDGDAKPAQ